MNRSRHVALTPTERRSAGIVPVSGVSQCPSCTLGKMNLRDTVRRGLLLYKMFGEYEMTDSEISKALALAIGWPADKVFTLSGAVCIRTSIEEYGFGKWKDFDYRDWNVIGPIAERYDCFPMKCQGQWFSDGALGALFEADTPQKAIALAVIASQGKTK